VCVFVEESPEWIAKVNAPSYVTVLPYKYPTRVRDWPQYASKTDLELYDTLFMKDLPECVSPLTKRAARGIRMLTSARPSAWPSATNPGPERCCRRPGT